MDYQIPMQLYHFLLPPVAQMYVIPNHVLLEKEIALQNLQQISDSNEYATDGLKEGTITYEVALERELEYQKRVKTFLTTFCYRYAAPYAISSKKFPLIFINS
ncbi:unnamed protein product [Musa textilis]